MIFTDDAEVIEVGAVFLQLISLNFVAQGIVFTCSGVFQGLGNTRPALLSSGVRVLIFVPIARLCSLSAGLQHQYGLVCFDIVRDRAGDCELSLGAQRVRAQARLQ